MAKTEEEICKECKGNCCRSMGCSLSPEDMIRGIRAWKETSGAEQMQHRKIEEAKAEEIMSEKEPDTEEIEKLADEQQLCTGFLWVSGRESALCANAS